MPIRDLRARLRANEPLTYPGVVSKVHPDGHDYEVRSPEALVGAVLVLTSEMLQRIQAGYQPTPEELASLNLDDAEERNFYQMVLGDTYQQMVEDKVAWEDLKVIALDAFACFSRNEEYADLLLAASLGKIKARRAQDRRAPRSTGRKTAGSRSRTSARTSTATPARTRSQASTRSSKTPAKATAAG